MASNRSYAYVEVHFPKEDGSDCTMYRRSIPLNQRRQVQIFDLLNEDNEGDDLDHGERPIGLPCGQSIHDFEPKGN